MNYIKKYQDGGWVTPTNTELPSQWQSFEGHQKRLQMGRDASLQVSKPTSIEDQASFNNAATDKKLNQGTISAYQAPSLREKLLGTLGNIDRQGDNKIAGIATQPLRSALTLLRPDKYFSGVQNDSDVIGGAARLGMDALSTVSLIKGVGKVTNYVPGATTEIQQLRKQHFYHSNPGEFDVWTGGPFDPRTIAERGVDAAHDAYDRVTPNLNVNSSLVKLRTNYLKNRYSYNGSLTPEGLEGFVNSPKAYMKADGFYATKTIQSPDKFFDTQFGDSKVYNNVRNALFPKPGMSASLVNANATNYMLHNDPEVTGYGAKFRANLDIPNKQITNYGFQTTMPGRAGIVSAAKITNLLEKNGPMGYTYEPGSLSGDSFTALTAGARRSGNGYVPTRLVGNDYDFGTLHPFNNLGNFSGLSKQLDTGSPEALSTVRAMNEQNLINVGVPTDTRKAMMDHYDAVGQRAYYSIPLKKVTAGEQSPINWDAFNSRLQQRTVAQQAQNSLNGRTLDELNTSGNGGADYTPNHGPTYYSATGSNRGAIRDLLRGSNPLRLDALSAPVDMTLPTHYEYATRVGGINRANSFEEIQHHLQDINSLSQSQQDFLYRAARQRHSYLEDTRPQVNLLNP